jgi:hypothetical protein
MFITILAEPRSGSTNLTNWFYFNKKFTALFIPSDPKSKWYQNGIHPKEYKYNTEHILVKEDYYHYKNYSEFLEVSDKVICLYRENEVEQIESWINAKITNNWDTHWVYTENLSENTEQEILFFKELKKDFKLNYLDKNYFKISYEELYYNNGFEKIVNYLNMQDVKNQKFPIGKKYRIHKTKTLI